MAINLAELEVLIKAIGVDETKAALENIDAAGQEAADGLGAAEEGAKGATEAVGKLSPGLGTVAKKFEQLGLRIAGVNPAIAKLITSLTSLSPILLTITIAFVAIVAVYKKFKEEADKAREAQQKLNDALDEEFRLIREASIAGLESQRLTAQAQKIDAQNELNHLLGDTNDALQQELHFINLSLADQERVFELRRNIAVFAERERKAQEGIAQFDEAAANRRTRAAAQQRKEEQIVTNAIDLQAERRVAALEAQKQIGLVNRGLSQDELQQARALREAEFAQLGPLQDQVDKGLELLSQGKLTGQQQDDLNRKTMEAMARLEQAKQRIIRLNKVLGIPNTLQEDKEEIDLLLENLRIKKQMVGLDEKDREIVNGLLQSLGNIDVDSLRKNPFGEWEFPPELIADLSTLLNPTEVQQRLEQLKRAFELLGIHVEIPVTLEFKREKTKTDIKKLREQTLADLNTTLVQGMSNAISDMFQQGFEGANFGKAILGAFGQMMVEQGQMLISYGLVLVGLSEALKNIFTAGPAAIAAGIALVALGSEFGAIANKHSKGGGGADTSAGGTDRIPDEVTHTRIPTGGLELATTASLPSGNTFVIIGPDDARAQDQIVKLLQNAQRRGHSL